MDTRLLALLAAALLLLTCACSATDVSVSANKEIYASGETVELTLIVNPTEKVGGQFVIYERVNNTYRLERKLYIRPSPSQCPACTGIAGGTPLNEFLNETFHYLPPAAGEYNADANFAGVKSSVNFTVRENMTFTTTTLPRLRQPCSAGPVLPEWTSQDVNPAMPKLIHTSDENMPGKIYSTSTILDDDIHVSGYGETGFEIGFYVPEDIGSEASIRVKAGTEDGLPGITTLILGNQTIGSCTISGQPTGGVQGRWGECTAELITGALVPGVVNNLTVETNVVPDMFNLSFIDYDYMELICTQSETTRQTTQATTTQITGETVNTNIQPTTTTPPEAKTTTTRPATPATQPQSSTTTDSSPLNSLAIPIIGIIAVGAFILLMRSMK